MLLNYHIGRFVLGSLCVGDLVRAKPATRTLLKPSSSVTSSWSFILQLNLLTFNFIVKSPTIHKSNFHV